MKISKKFKFGISHHTQTMPIAPVFSSRLNLDYFKGFEFIADGKIQYVSDLTPPCCADCLSLHVNHSCDTTYVLEFHPDTINLTNLKEGDDYTQFYCDDCSPFSDHDSDTDDE